MHPKIKFQVSIPKDVATFYAFAGRKGRFLDWSILKPHPYFKKYMRKGKLDAPRKEVLRYVRDEYSGHKKEIAHELKKAESGWRQIEKRYFELTNELFGKGYWPKGKYTCYPTIWGMYPRFLKDCTFQISAGRNYTPEFTNAVIAHEMLHFIFFNYFRRSIKYSPKGYPLWPFWHASEIFNTVVQDSPAWHKVFEVKSSPYPEHVAIAKRVGKKYHEQQKWDLNTLFIDISKEVREAKLGTPK